MARDLTERQQAIYQFIAQHIRRYGFPPTVREIGEEFGIASPNGVVVNLKALERKGVITREAKMSRGIRLTKGSGKCPLCGGDIK